MVESAWGLSENNRRAKYYELTPAGRRHLEQKAGEFTAYATAMFRILEAR
jgi:DNA-binding PadR family transcriptional regulator